MIFIPAPTVGHFVSAVEFAKLLVSRDDRISISILVMHLSFDSTFVAFTHHLKKDARERIAFVDIPALDDTIMTELMAKPKFYFFTWFIESQKAQVRDVVATIMNHSESSKLVGFVIDMMCETMIDVANEYNVSAYILSTSSTAFLGLMFYDLSLEDKEKQEIHEYKDSYVELSVPCFLNPVPSKVLPSLLTSKDSSSVFRTIAQRSRETKGIIINTVLELEPYAIKSIVVDENTPPLYHVGPIIKLKAGEAASKDQKSEEAITSWLDSQPPASVVFLCFGSWGSFDFEQITEIACALELSGQLFLWSLRRPTQEKESIDLQKDYENYNEVLPEGFLERTAGRGKVIGWAPQMTILSHPAVGGFVSHCGWNSTLESIWCGVPIAAWPMYAEQQLNAFELVRELGLAVEIKMDYVKGTDCLVKADEIERGIWCLMQKESETRKKAKEMKGICRKATAKGGSSYTSVGQFMEDLMDSGALN